MTNLRPQVGDTTNLLLKKLVEATQGISGGGIPDAPVDGLTYGRKDAAWIAIQAGYIDGEVQFYTNLPVVVGIPPLESAYLVREPSGVWLINYHPAGIYIRTGNAGSLSDWTYAGEFPDVFSDANFRVYNDTDSSKQIAFDVSGLVGIKTAAWQNKNGTVAMRGDIAFSAQGGSSSFETLSFRNANGISFSNSLGSIEASYTVPVQSVQPGIQSISGGTTRATTGEVIFSNSNNVTFGLNGNVMTASASAASSQGSINFSGGTTSNSLSAIVFSNSNNVSFGLNGSTMTASATVASSQGSIRISAGTTNTLASNFSFANGSNISFGLNGGTITGSVATSLTNINFSGGTTSNNLSALVFSNSNNVSFGLNGSTVTASATVASSQGSINFSAGTTSFNSSQVSFANSNGISFGANAGTITGSVATSLTNMRLSAGTTSNLMSAMTFDNAGGVSFGLNGSVITASAPGGAPSPVNFSAGTTSNNLGSVVFSNNNGISFGLNGSTVTGSVATSLTAINISAGTTSNNLSALTFSDGNGVSFGMNGSVVTASVIAAGGGITFSGFNPYPDSEKISGQVGQGTINIDPVRFDDVVFDRIVNVINFTGTSNSSGSFTASFWNGLYTRNVSTLSLLSSFSTSVNVTMSGTVGSYSLFSGQRNLTIPASMTVTAGDYWLAVVSRTTTGGAAGMTMAQFVLSNINSNFLGLWGASNNTTQQLTLGQGVYTATSAGLPNSIGFSQIRGSDSMARRAPFIMFANSTV